MDRHANVHTLQCTLQLMDVGGISPGGLKYVEVLQVTLLECLECKLQLLSTQLQLVKASPGVGTVVPLDLV